MTFATLTAAMDAAIEERLADSITYTPSGGVAAVIDAYAETGERIETFGNGAAQVVEAFVEIGVEKLAAAPTRADRIVMPDGAIYSPLAWPKNEDATFYLVTLKKVANA